MAMSSPPIVGITRFSVASPKGSGLNLKNKLDADQYLKELFDEHRLRERAFIFGELASPIYQTFSEKYNYTHLVQYSSNLPQKWKDWLYHLSDRFSVIRPTVADNKDMVDSVRDHVRSLGKNFRGEFCWFRIDDDDILSVDWMDQLSNYIRPENVGMAVVFPNVLSAMYVAGTVVTTRVTWMPNFSAGQAFICRANNLLDTLEAPPMLSHPTVDRHLPTISLGTFRSTFRTVHPLQDTAVSGSKVGSKLANLQATLSKSPAVSRQEVVQSFPTVEPLLNKAGDGRLSITRHLAPYNWTSLESMLSAWPKEAFVRMDYSFEYEGQPHELTTVSFRMSNPESVAGHFPRDDSLGDYRRVYPDRFGHGSILLYLPDPNALTAIRLDTQPGKPRINAANITLTVSTTPKIGKD